MSGSYAPPAVWPSRRGLHWYHFAAGFVLFDITGGLSIVDRMMYGEWDGKSGDSLTQILNLFQIALSVALFVGGYLRTRRLTTGAILAIALAVFLCATSLWSIEPSVTLRRGILYLLFVLFAIGVADNLDGDEFMALLRTLCFISAAVSLLAMVAAPSLVLSPGGGELRGNFSYKGVLGQVMAVGVLATLHGLRTDGRRLRGIAMLVPFLVVTLLANSGTALTTIVLSCVIDLVMTLLRQRHTRAIGMLLCAVVLPVAVGFALAPDLLLDILGKDPTLTGRTELWEYVDSYIGQRPVLGWGFAAFWSPDNPLAKGVSAAVGWTVPEAHNAVREMLLQVGVLGSLAFLGLFARNIVIALRCLRTPARELAASALVCHFAMIMVGVTEEVLVDPSQFYVGVFFVSGLLCDKMLLSLRETRFARVGALYQAPAR
jgi:O-antigen ligase